MTLRKTQQTVLEGLEARRTLSANGFEAHIDFAPASSPAASGYVVDSGGEVARQPNGMMYGWSRDTSAGAVDTGIDAAAPYSTFIAMDKAAEWEIIVPNGTYNVQIAAGDPTAINSTYGIKVNGNDFLRGSPTRRQHILQATKQITVTNGRLIVTNDSSAVNSKIDSIDLSAVNAVPAALTVAASGENAIQAHGGDIIYQNGVYYWYGENKDTPTYIQKQLGQPRVDVIGINVYASLDLHTWDYRGLALTGGDRRSGPRQCAGAPEGALQRPHEKLRDVDARR